MILATFSYVIVLSVLALVIGFSPILYGIMAQLSADKSSSRAPTWLVGGVIVGIVCMFALGGSTALAIEELRKLIGGEAVVRYLLLGVVGLLGIVYLLRQRYVQHTATPQRARRTTSGMQSLPLFLFAAVRTVTSVSGLAAVVVITGAITSYSIPFVVTFALVLPFVCLVAITPFLMLARGSKWQAASYAYIARQSARVRAFMHLHESVFQAIVLLACIALLLSAGIGLLSYYLPID